MANQLNQRFKKFRGKYFTHLLLQGLVDFITQSLIALVPFVLVYIFVDLNPNHKWGISAIFYAILLSLFLFRIGKPLFRLIGLYQPLTDQKIARIIGSFFTEVNDKVVNAMELSQFTKTETSLAQAALDQKLAFLENFNFNLAINTSGLKKSLLWLLTPTVALFLFYFINPTLLKIGSEQLINFGEISATNQPIKFTILNDSLRVAKNNDFTLKALINNSLGVKKEAYIHLNGDKYRLAETNNKEYTFTIKNASEDFTFFLSMGNFYSEKLKLSVFQKVFLGSVSWKIFPPKYTGLQSFTIDQLRGFAIPIGSKLSASFACINCTEKEIIYFNKDSVSPPPNLHSYTSRYISYMLRGTNSHSSFETSTYPLELIDDKYPQLQVNWHQDTLNLDVVHVYGNYSDDYGISKLSYSLDGKNYPLAVESNGQFYLAFTKNDTLDYSVQISVYDNDGVVGPKRKSSELISISKIDALDEAKLLDKLGDELTKNEKETKEELDILKKELEELKKMAMQKGNQKWNQNKSMKQLEKASKFLNAEIQKMEKLLQQMEKNSENPKLDELKSRVDELKQNPLLDEIKKLQEELDKNQKMDPENLEKLQEKVDLKQADLERTLELLKRMKVEQDLENQINKLRELAKQEKDLAKQESPEEKNAQESIKKEFESVRDKLDNIKKENQDLKDPMDLNDTSNDEEKVQEKLDSIEKNQKSGDSQNQEQKEAGEKMEEMADAMESAMQSGSEKQAEEDIETIRQILDNLITMSKSQENILEGFRTSDPGKPDYVKNGQEQRKLLDNSKIISDSLMALAQRVPELTNTIHQELGSIERNLNKTITHIVELDKRGILEKEQYVITHTNNLALILDESLQNMKQNQSKSKSQGSCKKPGSSQGSKPSMSDALKKQQELNRKMAEQKGKGEKKGKGKEKGKEKGEGQGAGPGGKEFMQMVKEQEQIRKMLQEIQQEMNEDGSGNGNKLAPLIKDMEELEWELLQKNLTIEMLQRQQRIESRLLESEKAERERDKDTKRESKSALQTMDPKTLELDKTKNKGFNSLRKNHIPVNKKYQSIIQP